MMNSSNWLADLIKTTTKQTIQKHIKMLTAHDDILPCN
jgi:hypothetical protein